MDYCAGAALPAIDSLTEFSAAVGAHTERR
jgi:hypothetical protein